MQLAVLNGKQGEKKSVPITVEAAPANQLMAVLRVTDQGTRAERLEKVVPLMLAPEAKAKPFDKVIYAQRGYQFSEAKVPSPLPAGVRNVAAQVSPDRKLLTVRGELLAATKASPRA